PTPTIYTLSLHDALPIYDVSKIALKEETGGVLGGAQYSVICAENGGVLDDVFTYRLDAERYLTVTNAANHARDLAWFEGHLHGRSEEHTSELQSPCNLVC